MELAKNCKSIDDTHNLEICTTENIMVDRRPTTIERNGHALRGANVRHTVLLSSTAAVGGTISPDHATHPVQTRRPTSRAYHIPVPRSGGETPNIFSFFFFQAEDGIRDFHVTGVQTCALPIYVEVTDVVVDTERPCVQRVVRAAASGRIRVEAVHEHRVNAGIGQHEIDLLLGREPAAFGDLDALVVRAVEQIEVQVVGAVRQLVEQREARE